MSRPIIFLGFEGVLSLVPNAVVCQVLNTTLRRQRVDEALLQSLFCRDACENLARLQQQHNAQFVITSIWGDVLLKDELRSLLERCKLDFITANLHKHWRIPFDDWAFKFEEIDDWLRLYRRDMRSSSSSTMTRKDNGTRWPLTSGVVPCPASATLDLQATT